jgi:hypothetical protein
MNTDHISYFCECVRENPYFAVVHADAHRMQFGFSNLDGLAMLCNAAEGANIADGLSYSAQRCDPVRPALASDFAMYLRNFSASAQAIYFIHLCWSLTKRSWNAEAVQACERILQERFKTCESD